MEEQRTSGIATGRKGNSKRKRNININTKMSIFFVYTHTIQGRQKPFFIGKGTKRVKGKTHKSQYNRAYSKQWRNDFWHKELGNKKYNIEIVYESSSEIDALNKEKALKKKYGMRKIIIGWGYNKKYIKGNGCLVNVQENEHRINKCTGKVCPFCEGRSVWKGDNKNSYYCSGGMFGFCEGTEGWMESKNNQGWTVYYTIPQVQMKEPIPESEIDEDFLERTGEMRRQEYADKGEKIRYSSDRSFSYVCKEITHQLTNPQN